MSNEAIEVTFVELALLSKIYVHSCMLVFPTRTAKTNQITLVVDTEKWDVFAKCFQAQKSKTFVAFGCFSI